MALVSKKAPSQGALQKVIKVNPYEIQDNVLDIMGQIAAATPNNAISEYWKEVNKAIYEGGDNSLQSYFQNKSREFIYFNFTQTLREYLRNLADEIQTRENTNHTQVVVAGGFSAGKSSFLNSLTGYGNLLPTGVEPVSVVSTYLYCSRGLKDVKVQGLNAKNAVVDLDKEILDAIKHSNGSSYHFASVLEKLFVTVPANSRVDGLAFIDTPGYDNSDVANASNGKTDRQSAEAALDEGQVLIWLVDAEKGALRKEDIAMINTFNGPKFIVFNKADKKGSACKSIVETAYSELSRSIENKDSIIDVLAYSTLDNKVYYSMSGYNTIDELLNDIKTYDRNGLSGVEVIKNRIAGMFDDEINSKQELVNSNSEYHGKWKDEQQERLRILQGWNRKETIDWANKLVVKSYGDILKSAQQYQQIAYDAIDDLEAFGKDCGSYYNGKLFSSGSLECILDRYHDIWRELCEKYNKTNDINYTYWEKDARQSFVDEYDQLYEKWINYLNRTVDEARDHANSCLEDKEAGEKFIIDIYGYKSKVLGAIDKGIEEYRRASAQTNVVQRGDTERVDIFSAIDKDDMKLFTKCFVSGVDMSICNAEGYSPLTYAVKSGNNAMVKFLIDKNADPKTYDKRGYNAFHTAVENQYKDICDMLFKADSDLAYIKTERGESVSDLLEKNTFKSWIKSKI